MEKQLSWTTLWVDSIDRRDWIERVKQIFDLPGVKELQVNEDNGEVRVNYDPSHVTMFQLSAHLRAAGL
ncbi:MAG TPA: hypothetical protein G4N94_07980 [Caldilineae bacterium]|nr:hypothetical protein [Caldilineae bacterium]